MHNVVSFLYYTAGSCIFYDDLDSILYVPLLIVYSVGSGVVSPKLCNFGNLKLRWRLHQSQNNPRVAEPQLPAPEDGRPGRGHRLTPDAPHNGGRPPPPGTAPHQPRGTQPPQGMQATGTVLGPHTRTPAPTARRWRVPTARPEGKQSGEGERLTSDAPHNGARHPPPGTPIRQPHNEQRRPARAHAVGSVLGPHARTNRTRDTRAAAARLPAPENWRPGEGQGLTPDAPHNGGRPPPPGTAPHHPCGTQPPQGAQAKGTVLLDSHTRTPAPTARGWRTPTVRPEGGQSGEGGRLTSDAPHNPPAQGMQAKGTVLGPHTRTPAPTARWWRTPTACPEGGQPGEGWRLTSDAPHNGDRHPPRGTPSRRPPSAQRRLARATGAGSPRPHQPHPGHMGRGTPAARPRG